MIRANPALPSRRAVLGGTATATAGALLAFLGTPDGGEPVPARIVVATGPRGAVYLEVGHDLARAIGAASPGTEVLPLVTAATVDNLRLLAAGEADLGLASLDAAAGDPRVRTDRPASRSRGGTLIDTPGSMAISRWYDSFLHLVVPAASPVRDLAGCAGRRVAVGAPGSGTEFTTVRLLELAGVRPAAAVRLAQTEATRALARGTVDAVFSLTGFPTPAINALAARQALRLVPLAGYLDLLGRDLPRVYRSGTIPQGTYPGTAAIDTVYVPNVLLARPGLPDDVVRLTVDVLLSGRSRRYWVHPDSRRIDVRTAIATAPVPLHPVALAWLREHKP